MRKHNFSPGPGILPVSVLKQASEAVLDYKGSGMGLIEMSHRSTDFIEIMEEARQRVKQLFNLGDDYEVLFLQGGASLQFTMIPYNLLDENETAAYLETGQWAKGAIKEARLFGNVDVVASSAENGFKNIPKDYVVSDNAKYFHITTNNTIYGTEMFEFPKTNVPLIADMSSDIFSRPVDGNQFSLIYAGAQKNMGPSGTTMVVVKKDILGKVKRKIPSMLNYAIHIEKESMYNTPATFAIYVCLLTLRWIEELGGLTEMEKINVAKSSLLYQEIDNNPLFYGYTVPEDRSRMNVTFMLHNEELEKEFVQLCKERNISGIKGHRTLGGFRASLYNALPMESVEALVGAMQGFAKIKG